MRVIGFPRRSAAKVVSLQICNDDSAGFRNENCESGSVSRRASSAPGIRHALYAWLARLIYRPEASYIVRNPPVSPPESPPRRVAIDRNRVPRNRQREPLMRPSRIVAVLILLAVAAGGLWYFRSYQQAPKGAGEGGKPPAATQKPAEGGGGGPPGGFAIPVEAAEAKLGRMDRAIQAVGTLRSNQSVVVRPEVAGRIVKIHFKEGQRVAEGARLVSLDDTIARAEVAQARAALTLSRANYERATELLGRGAGTQRTRDEALAKLRSDEANLALTEARLEKTVIAAPFEGIAGLRQVDIGDFVNVGQPIVNIEDIDPIKVDFRVPEVFLAAVAPGQRVEVGADAWPERTFAGELYAVDPLIDAQGRSIVIRAQLSNDDGRLRPGLFVRVRLILKGRDDAVLIPEQALVPIGQDRFVFRVADGKAQQVRVATGDRRDGLVEIVSGLKAGESVVTAGQIKLRDGAAVTVLPSAPPAPDAAAQGR
jgi:membrane fusion protein (multidrug efflux system)